MTDRKLCPREPTQEMLNAGGKFATTLRDAWVDMYDAAPDVAMRQDVAAMVMHLQAVGDGAPLTAAPTVRQWCREAADMLAGMAQKIAELELNQKEK